MQITLVSLATGLVAVSLGFLVAAGAEKLTKRSRRLSDIAFLLAMSSQVLMVVYWVRGGIG